jgi:hypothetical protein
MSWWMADVRSRYRHQRSKGPEVWIADCRDRIEWMVVDGCGWRRVDGNGMWNLWNCGGVRSGWSEVRTYEEWRLADGFGGKKKL